MTAPAARPRVAIADVHHVHIVAIAGVAMAALAGMLKQRSLHVTGSDEAIYPPMSTLLERLGIAVMSGYGAANLTPRPDLVVIGNKVSRDNPEVQAVLAAGLPYVSLPEALAELFIAGKQSLVVAGTHGKTTSTAMLGWVLECAGQDPTILVGGESLDLHGNFKLGNGPHFVIEGDEYDTAFFDKGPKFLHYRPSAAILTAVEFDHADIYADLDAVKAAFRRFVALLPAGAPLAVAQAFPHALEIAAGAPQTRCMRFGIGAVEAEWTARDLRDGPDGLQFRVWHRERDEGGLRLKVPGAMNAANALGVYALTRELGLSHAAIADGLARFSGVARRQELAGERRGVTVIDDFAHHPTAVAGTLAALRERYRGRRLWAVFEPRSNTSRRRVFQRDYVEALARADRVIIGGVFQKATDVVAAQELFSPAQLVADLSARGVAAEAIDDSAAIAATLAVAAQPGDVVVLMSNGSFGGLRPRLLAALGPA
ncbi:MAG: Mur ligase family protein [Deltaproteobacteria bacterium]|nr:Mur ligase family protein [Deltaproteobacteria bacterium]